jgi:hypothetical protein
MSGLRATRQEVLFERCLMAAAYAPLIAGWTVLAATYMAWTPNEGVADLARSLPVFGDAGRCSAGRTAWAFVVGAATTLALTCVLLIRGMRALPSGRAWRGFGVSALLAVIVGSGSLFLFYSSVCSVHADD